MGTDLQLTGLASGFDWAPVADQLIELERIPQKRLESEKLDNEEKCRPDYAEESVGYP